MSSDSIISVEGLGKRYRLGASSSNERYTALRDVLSDKAKSLFRRSPNNHVPDNNSLASGARDFWALKDVSFEVKQGEVLGIIGRNGAGKSTLLKILSRITDPTEGRIKIKGRVASLLEVGTGFHPELTGRENIYLNGAILGMHRSEIKAKFDEIVAFAEIEKFLDTPVKRYSSGMYVRLAFAVAAHLEPEILIVDEVLAVGDAEFQKKCLGKMKDVARGEGRTVLFVSHNMGAVTQLCSGCVVMAKGRLFRSPSVERGISSYTTSHEERYSPSLSSLGLLSGIRFIESSTGAPEGELFFGDPLEFIIELRNLPRNVPIGVNVAFRNPNGRLLCLFSTNPHDGVKLPQLSKQAVLLKLPFCNFAPGRYSIDVAVTEPAIRIIEAHDQVSHFFVHPKMIGGYWAYEEKFGDSFPPHEWQLIPDIGDTVQTGGLE